MQLRGRRVLVTGGSRGIGAGLARGFRAAGTELAVVARPSEDLQRVADEVGGPAHPCDLAAPDEVAGLVARVEADGPVDVLVNRYGPLRQLTENSGGRDITPMPVLVDRVVAAIEAGREEVRVPAMLAPMAAMSNAPRVLGRQLFRGAPAREHRSDGMA